MMLLFLAAAAAAIPPGKVAIQTYGYPETDSCAGWTAERSKSGYRSQVQEGWVLGFISGLNAFGANTGDIAPGTTGTGLLGWVDNYCKDNPLDSITTAGFKLANELKRRSRR